jgi:hypothetical protein
VRSELTNEATRAPLTRALPAAGVKLTSLFPRYEIMDPVAREVLVTQLAGVFEGAPLVGHLSVGAAAGGGVLAVLADLAASIDPRLPQARAAGAAGRAPAHPVGAARRADRPGQPLR